MLFIAGRGGVFFFSRRDGAGFFFRGGTGRLFFFSEAGRGGFFFFSTGRDGAVFFFFFEGRDGTVVFGGGNFFGGRGQNRYTVPPAVHVKPFAKTLHGIKRVPQWNHIGSTVL